MNRRDTIKLAAAVGIGMLGASAALADDKGGKEKPKDSEMEKAFHATMTEPPTGTKLLDERSFFTVRIDLPGDRDWTGAVFTVSAAWGWGNQGRDAWGWNAAGVSIGEVRRDGAGWFFLYSIQRGFNTSGQFMALFRYIRAGRHGVMTAGPHAYEA